MAHMQAALKALRQTKKRTVKNQDVKKTIAYLKKQTLKAVDSKNGQKAQELFSKLTKAVDKAAGRNVISKNTAARRKSRLAIKIKSLAK